MTRLLSMTAKYYLHVKTIQNTSQKEKALVDSATVPLQRRQAAKLKL